MEAAEQVDECLRARDIFDSGIYLGSVVVDVQRSQDQNQTREGRVTGNGFEPIVVQVEEDHLRLGGFQDQVSKLLHFEAGLEGQLQLRALDDNVGEIEKMHFKGIQHSFAGDDDLLGLLFYRQRTNQGSYFFGRLPFSQLTETFLTGPHGGVNDLQEQLSSARIENEDGSVDRFRCQVT